jgi:hypothetical protein
MGRPMLDTEEFANWLESRRLIIAKLSTLNESVIALDGKVDRYNEVARERTAEMFNECKAAVADLQLRSDTKELRARLWGAAFGLLTGGVSAAIIEMLLRTFAR